MLWGKSPKGWGLLLWLTPGNWGRASWSKYSGAKSAEAPREQMAFTVQAATWEPHLVMFFLVMLGIMYGCFSLFECHKGSRTSSLLVPKTSLLFSELGKSQSALRFCFCDSTPFSPPRTGEAGFPVEEESELRKFLDTYLLSLHGRGRRNEVRQRNGMTASQRHNPYPGTWKINESSGFGKLVCPKRHIHNKTFSIFNFWVILQFSSPSLLIR